MKEIPVGTRKQDIFSCVPSSHLPLAKEFFYALHGLSSY